ncbi:four-helix bundle copper-binding protein [Nitrosovibrio sp. Nv6]|uniref:four-helix bundle copper-binding protein n=1 Tax=Nitrosovibrio sp. Nv6 TaxID=1855340 RepID=UPI0021011D29|nr:four-helix bundle copper-binding protein [Nitrosovibrio sp. Nv6]
MTPKKETSMFMYMTNDQSMQTCIAACDNCHQTCLQAAMNHCLESGGRHVEAGHFRLMMNCAEICQTSLNFMLSGSQYSNQVCRICAEICDACAKSCEQLDGMDDCATACRECAQSCREMSGYSV